MRRKMYATAMTAMLVTGTLMGLAVPAAERDGVCLLYTSPSPRDTR